MLAFLRRQELFVLDLGSGNLRYHHIFHNFLRQQMSPEQCRSLHLRAGEFFLSSPGHGRRPLSLPPGARTPKAWHPYWISTAIPC
jgi:hypothetical protein